jgi:hypothetical protein
MKKPTKPQLKRYMKSQLKKYICRWAPLTPNLFSDTDSLKSLRPYFDVVSKEGMLIDATFDQPTKFNDEEMLALDTLNDFYEYLKNKGIKKLNPYKE